MADNRPIGIFDSGLGGLTVFKQVAKLLPNEDLIYLGDNARVPYGGRSKETITKFSYEDSAFLLSKGVKCVVIACNTSSAMAGEGLKEKLSVPVFDVISPALKEALSLYDKKEIGVIGTRGTISSGAYAVGTSKACPLLVPFIEEGETNGEAIRIVIQNYLGDFKKAKVKALILGCTHYPIIKSAIGNEIGKEVRLIDPGISVALELKKYLTEHNMHSDTKSAGKREYFVTDLTDRFKKVAEMFLGHSISGVLKKVIIG